MKRPARVATFCALAAGLTLAMPADAQEARVRIERYETEPVVEDLRIYAIDGSHITVTVRRRIVSVEVHRLNRAPISAGGADFVRRTALRCDGGQIEDLAANTEAFPWRFTFDCVVPLG